jgi:hypothetical protein
MVRKLRYLAALALALIITLVAVSPTHAEGPPSDFPLSSPQGGENATTAAAGRPYYYWNVTLTGESLGYPFQRSGYLIATPTIATDNVSGNGVNAFDIWLVSGNPPATPEGGSIWFATNRAFYGAIGDMNAGSLLDLAYVSWDAASTTLSVQVDPNVAAASTFNLFNASSGLLADAYLIRDGQMVLQFQDNMNSVVGQAALVGTQHLYYTSTPYNVTIEGTYGGQGVW